MCTLLKKCCGLLPALAWLLAAPLHAMECTQLQFLADERSADFFCLRSSYPAIAGFEISPEQINIKMDNGIRIPYKSNNSGDYLASDVASSLAQPYCLEPLREETPKGVAPGRIRSYPLLHALYGNTQEDVRRNMRPLKFMGSNFLMALPAADAFARAIPRLLAAGQDRTWLVPGGSYYWRKIAGEEVLSAHSFGIAIDLGVKKAPYWRWSKITPHPLQKTYPTAIVDALEEQGFIWGGKWHEYDLMHFEYRPEIICKARLRQAQAHSGRSWRGPLTNLPRR